MQYVNDLCDQYDSELIKVVDVHAPLKTSFVTFRPCAPWYSEEIAAEKRKRRKLAVSYTHLTLPTKRIV